ncbi:MAG: DinB family protein [Mucilaginibacter sp.]|uniref:DinB family protein n=1 Tax=Mucilaginibacter sp. TaxID=1882438 RepID=UPI0031AE80B5
MKAHFIKLFNYDRFANELINKAIVDAGSPQKPVYLLSHLLTAALVWLRRCQGLPNGMSSPWPDDLTAEQCAELIMEYHADWIAYLQGLKDDDFSKMISYQNFKGDHFQDQLSDIIAHVINHGTHTRAQIGQQLKFIGVETLPITDFSYYLRTLKTTI